MSIALASKVAIMAYPPSSGIQGFLRSPEARFATFSRPLAAMVVVSRFEGWPSRALRQLAAHQGRVVSAITRKGSGRFHRRCLRRYSA